jgi:hypothetical protein
MDQADHSRFGPPLFGFGLHPEHDAGETPCVPAALAYPQSQGFSSAEASSVHCKAVNYSVTVHSQGSHRFNSSRLFPSKYPELGVQHTGALATTLALTFILTV